MLRISTILTAVFALCPMGYAAQQAPTVERVPANPVYTVEGKDLFQEFCAVCHGVNAKGGGPAAVALKTAPTDLTQLTHKNKGVFPAKMVQQAIEGDENVPAHGAKEMPVWGKVLRSNPADRSSVRLRVYNLSKYIESLQEK